MKLWDYWWRRYVREGTVRWACHWELWVSDAAVADAQAHGLEEHHYSTHTHSFPNKGLAVAHARRLSGPLCSLPRVVKEVFHADAAGSMYGSWGPVGEVEEIARREEQA